LIAAAAHSTMSFTGQTLLFILLSHIAASPFAAALSHVPIVNNDGGNQKQRLLSSRRDILIGAAGLAVTLPSSPADAVAASSPEAESVDLAAFNAVRLGGGGNGASRPPPSIPGGTTAASKLRRTIVPSVDPSPLLPIKGGRYGKSTIRIPRAGYSLYKTSPESAPRCVALALRCGVRRFDVGTLYGSNSVVYQPLKRYLDGGFPSLKGYFVDEKPDLLEFLDATSRAAEVHATQTLGVGSKSISPPLDGSAGRRGRREQLFVSHMLSNAEQSASVSTVKRRVKDAIAELGVGYLDLVSIHSPLTDRDRRLGTYQALLELRDAGFVRAVGVCNYGIGPLKEIEEYVREDDLLSGVVDHSENLPALNQLELSPFNAHSDVVRYCDANGIAVGCAAWSKLSGVDGPSEGWAALADLAKVKGTTKAQILVRWALQKGYVCVPRSGCTSKVERLAIAENSYGGVNPTGTPSFVLSDDDMRILDGLDIGYKAGKLGRRDGWDDGDVAGPEWDPTEVV